MADILPTESVKARLLAIRSAPAGTPADSANAEWVEVRVELDSDLANWRVAHVRALWREEVARPIEWEWIYTFGSPHFARAGEIYRIHSGSFIRASLHPVENAKVPAEAAT